MKELWSERELGTIMSSIEALWRLKELVPVHRRSLTLSRKCLVGLIPRQWEADFDDGSHTIAYIGRNFFSLLLLSSYDCISFDEDEIIFLGSVNNVIRSIVTAADNIIDDEDKPALPLNMPQGAPKFRNSLALISWSIALSRLLEKAVEQKYLAAGESSECMNALMNHLVAIGAIEAEEEAGVDSIISPEEVIERVHEQKGGQLLALAFVVARFIARGEEASQKLDIVSKGIHLIGLALQHIDDITDLVVDMEWKKHNLLRSEVVHNGTNDEKAFLNVLTQSPYRFQDQLRDKLSVSIHRVVARALKTAHSGFGLLEQAGYKLKQKEAMILLKALFHVRGESSLLKPAKEEYS